MHCGIPGMTIPGLSLSLLYIFFCLYIFTQSFLCTFSFFLDLYIQWFYVSIIFSHGSFKMNEWDSKCINDIFEYFLDTAIRYETIYYDKFDHDTFAYIQKLLFLSQSLVFEGLVFWIMVVWFRRSENDLIGNWERSIWSFEVQPSKLEAFYRKSFIREGICRCDSDLGNFKLVTILEYWLQNIDVGDIFWMLVPDTHV